MRSISPLALFAILMLTSLSPLAFDSNLEITKHPNSVTSRDLIDFEVTGIEIGNSSNNAHEWVNSDDSIVYYVIRDELIQINVTFTQVGSSGQPSFAIGKLIIWHPIGFMIQEWEVNMTISGGQSFRAQFYWTPNAAHSQIDDDGNLVGGIILRGLIDGGLADGNSNNNQLDYQMPVAIWNDAMDNGICGDVDGDGLVDCPNQLSYGNPIWVSTGYDSDGTISDYPDSFGHWRMGENSSAIGERHWRVSRPGSDYASNRQDRLWWGWLSPTDTCDDQGHGFGYGNYDSLVSSVYANNFCKVSISGYDFLTLQLVTNAWGDMGEGDQIQIELDPSSSNSENKNYTYPSTGLSSVEGDWSQLIWDMTDTLPNDSYNLAFRFNSDSSIATEGIHLDGFIMFAIEKVPEYTLDLECDDILPNAYIVIPDDPEPPVLHCIIHNNGYIDIELKLYSEINNISWMYDDAIRIDSNNPTDHDNYVKTNSIKALNSTEVWFSLDIPDGAGVEELMWYVHIGDGVTNSTKNFLNLPVDVESSYSAYLTQAPPYSNPALTLLPGESGTVPMTLKNTGNKISSWDLSASFSDNSWGSSNIKWLNESGIEISSIHTVVKEMHDLNVHLTAPENILPGTYAITLLAIGAPPAETQSSWVIYIEIPIYHNLEITPEHTHLMFPADGNLKMLEIELTNLGNTEESFDLSVDADWKLGIHFPSEQTLGIDSFGGDTRVLLLFPMPHGIVNDTYQILIQATSRSDPSYSKGVFIYLTVSETYLIEIPDLDLTTEVYRGGDDPRTLRWEIWNHGNKADRFHVSFDSSRDDITAFSDGLNNGNTNWVEPGSSYNLTLTYSFGIDADGDRTVTMIAESLQSIESDTYSGQSVSNEGQAQFKVGQVGWLLVSPSSTSTLVIDDRGTYLIEYTVLNLHPDAVQLMRADIDRNTEPELFFNVIDVRVEKNDRDFVLGPGESRIVTVEVDVSEENLDNLAENSLEFNVRLAIDSDIDKVTTPSKIRFIKTIQIEEGPDTGFYAKLTANILFVIAGLIAMGFVLVITMRIIKDAGAPLEEYSSLDDYSSVLGEFGGDSSVPSAPSLPIDDDVANSMYGGTREIFETAVADMPPPPLPEPEMPQPEIIEDTFEVEPDDEVSTNVFQDELPPGAPPVPEDGLPDGWTMEQWAYYGQKWLDQNKGE